MTPDIADLVRRLRETHLHFPENQDCRDAAYDLLVEAADALESLLRQSAIVRALTIEEFAKQCDEIARSADELSAAALKRNDRDAVTINCTQQALAALLAAQFRALPATVDVEAMVERCARIMWIDTSDKDYWDHLDDDTRNIYRSNAVAVLSALGIK